MRRERKPKRRKTKMAAARTVVDQDSIGGGILTQTHILGELRRSKILLLWGEASRGKVRRRERERMILQTRRFPTLQNPE